MSRIKGDELFQPILDRQNLRGGVTIRAAFAMAAMQGIISNPENFRDTAAANAALAVEHADALIEALNKEEEGQ